jgi:UDP-N-acetylmuramyl pentapeptide phosphotransferase/UDP-N-acetylglucosamine-1-phosphate transferase
MNDALLLGVLALIATAIAGYPAISLLRRLKLGQVISEWGPETHQVKAGTPTMGGLLIVAVIGAVTIAFNLFGRYSIAAPLSVMGALTLVGFVDDLGSLQGRAQRALNKRFKLVAFLAIGAASAYGLSELLEVSHSVKSLGPPPRPRRPLPQSSSAQSSSRPVASPSPMASTGSSPGPAPSPTARTGSSP